MHKILHTLFFRLSLPAFCTALMICVFLFAGTALAETMYNVELQEEVMGQSAVTGSSGVILIKNYIGLIYRYAASLIGIICVLIIVVSGVQIMTGGLSSEGVNQAKERIYQALFSLILLFCTAMLLRTLNPGFFTA